MIYTIDEIKRRIEPVAKEYGVKQVYLFGSYARGEATEESDVDLLVAMPGEYSFFDTAELEEKFAKSLEKDVDLVTTDDITDDYGAPKDRLDLIREAFRSNVRQERVNVYG